MGDVAQTMSGDKAKILVTDDDSSVRGYIRELLTRQGYEVLLASSGEECLEIAKNEVPDLIFLDVIMPEMSGGMTAHHLAENMLTKEIPVIFLTSMISKEQEMVVENKEGKYLFLSKPVEVDKLLTEIRRALGARAIN